LSINRGAALLDLGRVDESLEECSRAVKLKPDSAHAHSNYASGLLQVGRAEEALEHARRATELDATHENAHRNLANAAYQLGVVGDSNALSEALRSIDRVIDLDSTRTDAHVFRSTILMALGHLDLAETALNELIASGQSVANARYNRACLLARRGDLDTAMAELETSIAEHPEGVDLRGDPDLEPLRSDPRFHSRLAALVAAAE
jgi:tetratricopeptide (TPR) repeat protein